MNTLKLSSDFEASSNAKPSPDETVEIADHPSTDKSSNHEFEHAYGEKLAQTLDIDKWATGLDWEGAVGRLREEIGLAVRREEEIRAKVRKEVVPRLETRLGAPKEAGVYLATPDELTLVHEGLLFPGRVEAVDGTSVTHDTLPLEITQIGIAVVSYGGTAATFSQRIFRKEIAGKYADPLEAALDLIEKREKREGIDQKDSLSELARRGIMTFAERKILLDKATSDWRIGHGSPVPYELITGSGDMNLLLYSIDLLGAMIRDFQRFVFVPSAPSQRGYLTIGNALMPGEYAIVDTIEPTISRIVENGHYGEKYASLAKKFVRDFGPEVLVGLYKTSDYSPAYLFYGHKNHIHTAARIAMADSILRPARGFPMLIDVADVTCRNAFGSAGFYGLIHSAYADAGAAMKYLGERETRR